MILRKKRNKNMNINSIIFSTVDDCWRINDIDGVSITSNDLIRHRCVYDISLILIEAIDINEKDKNIMKEINNSITEKIELLLSTYSSPSLRVKIQRHFINIYNNILRRAIEIENYETCTNIKRIKRIQVINV